ncbi:MAG: PKD domain-containing protein [Bacteroidia bacterium]
MVQSPGKTQRNTTIVCVWAITILLQIIPRLGYAQVNANFTANTRSGCSPLTVSFTDLSSGNIHTWLWDFGNGNTSTFDNVIAIYTNPGTYSVSLTVRDTINGFVSIKTETAYITVYEDPVADFTADLLSGCAPLTVAFSDNSTSNDGNITSWTWDFGDGNLGTGANPGHTYNTGGTYSVTLVVVDDNGCRDTRIANDLIAVTEVAAVNFTANRQTACSAPLTVRFTSSVTPSGSYTYLWDFGDGTTSSAANPNHTYSVNGDYTVSLTVSDATGCQTVQTKDDFIIINQPNSDFVVLNPASCTGIPIQFANNSTGADSYLWTFGDGTTSTATNPTHTYSIPGTYTVSLTATNSAGCSDFSVQTNVITINPAPAVTFSATNNIGCNNPLVVPFQSNTVGNIVSWNWNFGNGNTSNSPNPTTTYTNPGIYTVSLTVTSNFGCQATETIPAYVQLREPTAQFTMSRTEGCIPLTVDFIDLSTSPADPIVSWVWNFGDGNVVTGQNPSHTYTNPGQYTVTLTVTTQSGCQDIQIFQFIEAGTPPIANFDANPLLVCVGADVNFTDLSQGTVTAWYWNFGDGNGSNVPNPIHQYQDTGLFDVVLIVEYYGCFDTLIRNDLIRVVGPIADFTMSPNTGCNPPTTIYFFDQSINASSWFWTFGDGTTSSQQNPTHVYTTTGTYTITLVVDDDMSGCTDNFQDQITITEPQAAFTANPLFGCSPHVVNFTNSSSGATNYFWSFGDGATSTAANPSHTYTLNGVYDVRLIASDGVCADTLIRQNYIDVTGPDPDFTTNNTTGCAPLPVSFTSTSTPASGTTITNYLWNFGDGGTSTLQNPVYSYATPGLYTVSLTVLDSDGCLATISRPNIINPTFPTADFTSADTIACPGAFVRFTNLSSGSGLSYLWDFGDGTTSTAVNPVHLFPANSSYTVTLTATDINGCADITGKINFVTVGQPTAAFFADNTSATCPPLTVHFTDQSSANIVTWFWDFGDGSTSILPNPSKIYATAGNYDVTLIVTTSQGCKDTLERAGLINISGPTGAFTFSPTTGCKPLAVNFSATAPNPLWTYEWDFGDGTGSVGASTSHTYVVDTTASPVMIIEDENGCRVPVTNSDSINILPLPQPSFVADITQVCLGQTVSFANTSISKRAITSFFWDFGDGTSSTAINPFHTYSDTGTYQVLLHLTTVDGCSNFSPTPVSIRVTQPPTAFFRATPNEGCEPYAVAFADSSYGVYPLVSWTWNFGDGSGIMGGQTIIPHIYTTAGVYNANLTVTDSKGCIGTTSRSVRVNPLPPVNFSAFRYGCAPITVAFSDLTVGTSPSVAWLWNFGDGTTSTLKNPTHIYPVDGNYSVSLTVTDSKGCSFTLTKPDYIKLEHPVAAFTSNAGINCPPQTVRFRDRSVSDTTITWFWDFGDGTTSTQRNPTHTYYASDTFDVMLIVTNIFGCSDTIIAPHHVINYPRPTASFTVSDTANCAPLNVVVTSTSIPSGAPLSGYQWDFGLGSGSGTPTASYLYTTPGNYSIRLIISDVNGCKDTASHPVYINPNPTADFIAGDTVGCSITSIGFTDLSSGTNAPVWWYWTFGDGNVSTAQNPVNTYFNDGTYTVSLTVMDVNGCRDSVTKTDYIFLDHPTANFTANDNQICPGETINFTDVSTGMSNFATWKWNFGDGGTSTLQNPSHTYTTPGFYNVTLIVSDLLGCSDTIVKPLFIRVFSPPVSDFTASPPQGCTPLTVLLSDASITGSGSIVNWNWNFGDGVGSAVIPNPTYVYNNPGGYIVRLTVTDANGCSSQSTEIVEALESPVVDFIANQTVGCSPTPIFFSDLTTTAAIKISWLWDFGDGTTSSLATPTHTYTSDGDYSVKLVVTDQNGCKDSLTKVNYIRLSHPVAGYTFDQNRVCPNIPVGVTFTDASVPDTTIVTWFWQFGDGGTSNLQNPSHSYSSPGIYTTTLTVTNVLGCQSTFSQANQIEVLTPPVTQFTMSDSADCNPFTISFTDISVPGDANIVAWSWDFGNGATSLAPNPSYTWTTPGVYNVTLTTTDNNGCQTTSSKSVRSWEIPVADFRSADTLGCAPQTVRFINQTSSPYNIVYTKWFFGDGDSVEYITNPVHTYASDGIYSVTLITEDIHGCRDTLVRPNYIRLSHPTAQFNWDQNTVCPGIPIGVTFTDLSIADTTITSWFWTFGDGGTSNQQNPSHSYSLPGTYSVTLIVRNILGCADTTTVVNTITVLNPPVAQFTVSDSADCLPFPVTFTDGSVAGAAPIVSWNWDFGNGATSLISNPTYTYTTAGSFNSSLTVTDANGCQSIKTKRIDVFGIPQAAFTANDTLGCAPLPVAFTDLSSGPSPINQWLWTFGDGNTAVVKNPLHTYNGNGNYTVSLKVTDTKGCTNTVTKPNYVKLTNPVANFTWNRAFICPGTIVDFRDVSLADHPLTTWLWDFGDGTTASTQHPSHMYTTAGMYTVTLTVTNALNCSDTEVKTAIIQVIQRATAQFTPSVDQGCEPLQVVFTNTTVAGSTPVVSWLWNYADGTTSALMQSPHTFTPAGVYPVSLTAVDANGCRDTFVRDITVFLRPTANFVASDSTDCAPTDITFFDHTSSNYVLTNWLWNFGDGNTSTSPVPVNSYANDGVYPVSLIVTDVNGCKDTLVKPNYIHLSHPVANFSVDQNKVCPGTTLQFTDISVPDTTLMTWLWDFGDGTTSSTQNPGHVYSIPGFYTVTLTITNVNNCSDTRVRTNMIEVFTPPTPSFAASDTSDCFPMEVTFNDLSVGNSAALVGWLWDFGNGSTSTIRNPHTSYPNPGSYNVTLTTTDNNGCTASHSLVINSLYRPTANFISTDSVGCAGSVAFADLSTGNQPIVAWLWSFGDGTTSTLKNPAHSYPGTGIYTVSLIVWDMAGCSDTLVKPDYINLTRPVAAFTQDIDVTCPGGIVTFRDISTPDYPLIGWFWNFGDGGTSTQQNPVHMFNQPGLYTVSLVITNSMGCQDTAFGQVEVLQPPVASFIPSTIDDCTPVTVSFTDNSQPTNSPIIIWEWNFGDGSLSSAQSPIHTYTNAGQYTVTLRVTDGNGCISDTSMMINARQLPIPDFVANKRVGCAPESIQFTSISTSAFPIISWWWNFGDGNTATGPNPSHTYASDGLYTVQLVVLDANGCSDTLTRPNYIRLTHPQANFTFSPGTGCPGLVVNFTDVSIADTTLNQWLWNFGDGTTSTLPNPQHVYNSPGTYSVSLTVTNVLNCTDTEVKTNIIVVRTPPLAGFMPADTAACMPFSLQFFNTSVPSGAAITNYNWDFANGNTSTTPNPSQNFSMSGNYDVRLIIRDANGCRDTAIHTVTVHPLPVPDFSATDSMGCAPFTVVFTDQTIGNAPSVSWLWDFGDGSTSSQPFPTHTYTSDGNYTVSLTIVDANGCSGTTTRPMIRLDHPVADFTEDKHVICPASQVNFTNTSLEDTTIATYHWSFGDGQTSSLPNPSHVYASSGTYTVSLTITNIFGCSDTRTKVDTIIVRNGPNTLFVPDGIQGCTPFNASFTDFSTGNGSPIVNWNWNFGDGGISSAQNPNHTYLAPGTYNVTLTTTDNNGCTSSFSRPVISLTLPTANFMTVDTIDCSPVTIMFNDLSGGNYPLVGWLWNFGDGGTSTLQFPTHTYNHDGNYDVSLVAVDVNGCRDTLVKPNYIHLSNPQPAFTYTPAVGCPGMMVSFTDQSIADTTLVSWLWTFGDGTTSIVKNPTHVYHTPGQYTVTLTVTNVLGCTKTHVISNAITVSTPPVAGFSLPDSIGCTPFSLNINDQTQTVSAPIVSWLWDFGNGDTSHQQEPLYTYMVPGTYVVTMFVQDANGCTDVVSRTVVSTDQPVADFNTRDTLGCAPHTADFRNFSTGAYPVTGWLWDFGDGSGSTDRNPIHTYMQDGVYTVRLIVFDENGCTDTLTRLNYIRLSHPDANYTADIVNGCVNSTVHFTSTSLADTTLTGWVWNFGDGTGSVQQNPTHTYTQNGDYTVTLIVTNILGCKDTIVRDNFIEIYESPNAVISASDTTSCGPFTVNFEDWSSSPYGINQWQWMINNTPVAISQNMSYFFQSVGSYRVTLVVTDQNGCVDSTHQMVYLRPLPLADFTASDTIGCSEKTITFRDLTWHIPSVWQWDFGDGQQSNQQNPVHTYTQDGIYTINLYVEDAFGCADEITKINHVVLDHPDADFTVDYESGCPPIAATFHATGSGLRGIATWRWNFGDGSAATSLKDSVVHAYTQAGTYLVTLTAIDSLGCEVVISKPNLINVLGDIVPSPIRIHAVSVVSDEQVEVKFAPHDDDDFKSYTVYREDPALGYIPVYTTDYINDTIFIDKGLQTTQNSYCYKVAVTNYCGSESSLSLTNSHCTIDVLATPIPGEIVISWNMYKGWPSVEQYEIYRVNSYNKLDITFLGIVPGTVNRFSDPVETCFSDYAYRIKATGELPVQESWSDTTMAVNWSGVVGRSPEVLRATVENNRDVLVEWKEIDLPGAVIIHLQKAERGGAFQTIAALSPDDEKFLDQNVEVAFESYAYRISAQDSCGNNTPISNIGKTVVVAAEKNSQGAGSNKLSWNSYKEWRQGVANYRIEVYNDSAGKWDLVAIVDGTDTTYTDDNTTLPQGLYCYRIWAIEKGGNQVMSLSNEVCLDVEFILYAPNAFTPNGDQVNDIFVLKGSRIETYNLQIFSRWGMKVFETNNIEDGWDGRYNGKDVGEGVYVFIARGIAYNGRPYLVKGSITLLR